MKSLSRVACILANYLQIIRSGYMIRYNKIFSDPGHGLSER
jgi:hypothetical protein